MLDHIFDQSIHRFAVFVLRIKSFGFSQVCVSLRDLTSIDVRCPTHIV